MLPSLKKKLTASLILGLLLAGSVAQAGWINGPASHVGYVSAYRVDTYNLDFVAGREARITLEGHGDTDLALYVYDRAGNLVANDRPSRRRSSVRFVPPQSATDHAATYTIRVINRGSVWNRYEISVN